MMRADFSIFQTLRYSVECTLPYEVFTEVQIQPQFRPLRLAYLQATLSSVDEADGLPSVSYTHLDVYKRQPLNKAFQFRNHYYVLPTTT